MDENDTFYYNTFTANENKGNVRGPIDNQQTIRGLEAAMGHPKFGRRRITQRTRAIKSVLIAQDTAQQHNTAQQKI